MKRETAQSEGHAAVRGQNGATAPTVDISVLVPVLNEARHLRDAVDRMLRQEFDGELEFLFVDGGSHDATAAILAEFSARDPRVQLLLNPARRTPQALNIGLAAARGNFVARMDAHTLYPQRYLATGVERLRRDDVAWVSGPQLAVGTDRWSRRAALALSTRMGTGGARFRHMEADEFEVDTGFAGVWRRETLVAQGGWDEAWLNDQDFELAARIRRDGGRIVCVPEMAAQYIPRDGLAELARQYMRYGFYRVKTIRRHPTSMRPSHVLPPMLAATAVAAAAGPAPVRRLGRTALAVYGAALAGTALDAARKGDAGDAAWVPAMLATMHLCYGAGFLAGCARFGPPLAGVAALSARNR